MLELRILTPDDWPLWRELRLAALADAPAAFGATLAEWSGEGDREERWRARLSIPGARDFVVLLDGTAVGMVSGVPADEPGAVDLISMWVRPDARGRGVGDRLIDAVRLWGEEQGATTLRLSVMRGNPEAIALYERAGFTQPAETVRTASNGRELVMVKSLSA